MSEDEEPEERDDEELEESKDVNKNREINDNDSSIPYASTLTTMEWSLLAHPDYHKDYWIGDSGASSHMVGHAKDLFAKTPIQCSVNAANRFCCVPVAWKSKSMKSVVLSTTEAEYVAVSEVVKEIKFLYQMLRSMEVKDRLPIKVHVDNVGTVWLANNSSVSERTKHVDLRVHFVRDRIKDQVIEINFLKSAENDSDIMTKNQQGPHYLYAKSKLVYTVQEMNEKEGHQDKETGRMIES